MNRVGRRLALTHSGFTPNITFMGLGGGKADGSELATALEISTNNIRRWIDDGKDLHLNINRTFRLNQFGRNTPGNYGYGYQWIEGINDPSGLIYRTQNWSLADSPCRILNLQGLTQISNEGLRNVRKCVEFSAPNLTSIGDSGLINLGTDNGGVPIPVSFPLLSGRADFDTTRAVFSEVHPNVTSMRRFQAISNTIFPFPNITTFDTGGQIFRNARIVGDIVLNDITGIIPGDLAFDNCRANRVIIPNATGIGLSNSGDASRNTFSNMTNVTEIDIRNVRTWENQNEHSNAFNLSNSVLDNLTVHLNEALLTVNDGNPHLALTSNFLNRANIIWYPN